jgi:hypothetical protein
MSHFCCTSKKLRNACLNFGYKKSVLPGLELYRITLCNLDKFYNHHPQDIVLHI